MDLATQDYYLQWIIADQSPFRFGDRDFFLSTPSREARFQAERIYMLAYDEGQEAGLYNDVDIAKLLKKYSLWDENKEKTLSDLLKDVEEIKVKIFQNYINSSSRNDYKRALRGTMELIEKMSLEKGTFDLYSVKSVATFAKQHFLMGSSIFRRKGKPALGKFWSRSDDEIIQHCYKVASEYILSDGDYRTLARSANWRNLWVSRRSLGNLFGRAAVDLSLSQRQLVMWSSVYDSVYKSSECPPDSIVDDDDALDGWMIVQRRNRDKENNKDIIESSLQNEKIRNSDHIFIMCDEADASKVQDCNDFEGRLRMRQIMNQVQAEGAVGFMNLKDTQADVFRRVHERS